MLQVSFLNFFYQFLISAERKKNSRFDFVLLYIDFVLDKTYYLQASNTIYQEGFRPSELQVC
jgi:hypothetical protein